MRYTWIGVSLLFISCGMQSEQVLTLHYDKPATFFEEALPIGNGRLGAMIYGGTDEERISLNDITLWTGEPEPGPNHPDYELFPEITPWGEASAYINDIREALDAEDYHRADRLQRRVQLFDEGMLRVEFEDPLGLGDLLVHGLEEPLDVRAQGVALDDEAAGTVRRAGGKTHLGQLARKGLLDELGQLLVGFPGLLQEIGRAHV